MPVSLPSHPLQDCTPPVTPFSWIIWIFLFVKSFPLGHNYTPVCTISNISWPKISSSCYFIFLFPFAGKLFKPVIQRPCPSLPISQSFFSPPPSGFHLHHSLETDLVKPQIWPAEFKDHHPLWSVSNPTNHILLETCFSLRFCKTSLLPFLFFTSYPLYVSFAGSSFPKPPHRRMPQGLVSVPFL